jgi:glycosyltransferase involved in cell wall biosynthesis
VTINELSLRQLADRGIAAVTIYNSFEVRGVPSGAAAEQWADGSASVRGKVREALGLSAHDRLVMQPTRAIPRKNIAGGVDVATRLDAVYWLLGAVEDGYGDELAAVVAAAKCPVILGSPDEREPIGVGDAYRACDVVALPSTWEGFGNPTIESVVHRRPLAIGAYPVARELAAFGFEWFGLDEMDLLESWLSDPDPGLLDRNLAVARAHFALHDLPDKIAAALPNW